MAVLIDPSVFITLERRSEHIDALHELVNEEMAISTVAVTELLTGTWRADSPSRQARRAAFVETVIAALLVVPFDLRAARTHARLWAIIEQAGTPIGKQDLLIAATAIAHDYDLLTDNVSEYLKVPGLVVRRPTWSP